MSSSITTVAVQCRTKGIQHVDPLLHIQIILAAKSGIWELKEALISGSLLLLFHHGQVQTSADADSAATAAALHPHRCSMGSNWFFGCTAAVCSLRIINTHQTSVRSQRGEGAAGERAMYLRGVIISGDLGVCPHASGDAAFIYSLAGFLRAPC